MYEFHEITHLQMDRLKVGLNKHIYEQSSLDSRQVSKMKALTLTIITGFAKNHTQFQSNQALFRHAV